MCGRCCEIYFARNLGRRKSGAFRFRVDRRSVYSSGVGGVGLVSTGAVGLGTALLSLVVGGPAVVVLGPVGWFVSLSARNGE
jgi:hypothetical protein